MVSWFLVAGGAVGAAVSLVHGVLMGRFVTTPIDRALESGSTMALGIRRLVTPLLQYSTFAWFTGGLALMAAALTMGPETQVTVGALVGATYLYAAVANMWATGGRHPGGWLMALATGLIGAGLTGIV